MRRIIFLVIILIIFTVNCESKKQLKSKIQLNEKFLGSWDKQKQDIIGFCNTENRFYYASSRISDKYKERNMRDGNLKTCWATRVNGGIGEQFFLVSIFKPGTGMPKIRGILLYNGYCKNRKLYYENNRIKKIQVDIYRIIEYPIETDRGLRWYTKNEDINLIETRKIKLPDKYLYGNKIYFDIDLDEDFNKTLKEKGITPVYYFLFTIEDIYKGSKYNDLCVSEIKFIYK